jgi:aspartate/methionine/tyrosine aminotransferase
MDDILLAKPTLAEGFVDASVGEPYIIRDNLADIVALDQLGQCGRNYFEYQKPNGLPTLVKILEDKHQAPVVITNGAKQSIGALFYACKKLNKSRIGLRNPYWGLFKPLIEMHGLTQVEHIDDSDAYLLVHPNNPDGFMYDEHTLEYYTNLCKEAKKPLIHDGAYYSHVYIPYGIELKPIGDVQVFTFSKLFGLSGLRIGYSVFHNMELYKYVLEYMEHMTVGVSTVSQLFALDLVSTMKNNPTHLKEFESKSYRQLQENKQLASQINPKILDVSGITSNHGMFLWAPCYDFEAFKKAKINVIEGTPFGKPGYVRMNLAFNSNVMSDLVERLNKVK